MALAKPAGRSGAFEDLSNVEFETSEDVDVIEHFKNMNLKEELLRGVFAYGFEKPSAIQQRAIKPIIKGRDVIAQAQSGTGKTATFSIAILQSLDLQTRETQVLCLAHAGANRAEDQLRRQDSPQEGNTGSTLRGFQRRQAYGVNRRHARAVVPKRAALELVGQRGSLEPGSPFGEYGKGETVVSEQTAVPKRKRDHCGLVVDGQRDGSILVYIPHVR